MAGRLLVPALPPSREGARGKAAAQPLPGETAARRETREGRRRDAPTPSRRDRSATGRAGGKGYRRIHRCRVKRRPGGARPGRGATAPTAAAPPRASARPCAGQAARVVPPLRAAAAAPRGELWGEAKAVFAKAAPRRVRAERGRAKEPPPLPPPPPSQRCETAPGAAPCE